MIDSSLERALTGEKSWLLYALAVERALTLTSLTELEAMVAAGRSRPPSGAREALETWLESAVKAGFLVRVGAQSGPTRLRDPAYALHHCHEQPVLRELSGSASFDDMLKMTQSLLGARSVAELTHALQRADLRAFARAHARHRLPHPAGELSRAEWLRRSVCEPFDPQWLEHTWRSNALEVCVRVLRESAEEPSPCTELHDWVERSGAAGANAALARERQSVLCQHAILRGHPERVALLSDGLPVATVRGYEACAELVRGDLIAARQKLSEALHGQAKRAELPTCGGATPVLALLVCAHDGADARRTAKRLLGPATSDAQRGTARAFGRLLRYLEQPSDEHKRIDVHQLDPHAGAWELLFSALTVHLHEERDTTRAGWAEHVARKGLAWQAAGYEWLGRQACLLAAELDQKYAERALEADGAASSSLACLPGELRIWDLLSAKTDWQKAFEALSQISESIVDQAPVSRRVAWFIDMSDGSFSRPALQECRESSGWTAGQRVSIAELHAAQDSLPPEDLNVLACSREIFEGKRELTPDAYERLIGHPRVWNALRSQTRVDVVRGACRIETHEEGGYLRVSVEPHGAELGINVVPQGDARLVVFRVTPEMARVMAAVPRGIRVPRAHAAQFLNVIGKLSQSVDVLSAELGADRTSQADATPCLRVAPQAGAWLVQAGVRPFGSAGRFFLAGAGKSSLTFHSDGRRLRCERDLELERTLLSALLAECPSLQRDEEDTRDPDSWTFDEAGVLSLLSELRETRVHHALEWPESTRMNLGPKVTSKSLNARLRSVKGWYIATGGLSLDAAARVELSDFLAAPALARGRFVRLPNGAWLELEERVRRVIAALAAVRPSRARSGEIAIHPAATSVLRELIQPDSGVAVEGDAEAWLARVERASRERYELPVGLRAELRSYQLEGYEWLCRLCELGLGACLSDDMGLGKTVQILALLLRYAAEGPALVVAPTSVCTNWVLEMRRFAPGLEPVEYAGKGREAELASLTHDGAGKVVVVSYALLQQDQAELGAIEWGTAVLDEAQFIKNPESLRAKAALSLNARRRIAATGTPIENHFGDLWSIFQFINPGLLGEWPEFRRSFVRPLEREDSRRAETELRRMIRPYVLRRLKSEVLAELPPLTELKHEVRLSRDEELLYTALRSDIHRKLKDTDVKRQNKLQVLAEITRLRRFCCHPKLVFPGANVESSKIDTFLELVEELGESGHRALVFSQYVDFLSLVRDALNERAISYEYLDGATPRQERQARVDAFQNGSAALFLISLKAGGFGLNLTAADYVIHLDPWWNPAVEAQATDRAHRIGQTRKVTVYKLVTRNTIEDEILKLHERKRRLARSLLAGSEEIGQIANEELVELLEASLRS